MRRGTMMLLMQRNRRSDFEGREHYGVRYEMPRSRYIEPYGYDEPLSYYDERIHGREPEMRRYSNGRFAPRSSAEWPEYDEMPTSANRDMRPIGFRDGSTSYVGDETRGTEKRMGYARGEGARLNRQTAEKWVRGMKNADGSTGEHWSMEQTSAIMERHGLRCNPVKFWVAMNAVYSDLSEVAEKHGVGNEEFYADMAKSFWLCDRDAVEDKLGAYYENVVRH
nr:MAG TPA: protein of unknown function (DUF1858) [Caudoviricetes sp.]